uniref:Probable non-specific lipid-transfer protein 1 n=1 Tax=Parietaria judaica TaxID=33127 RepID=NLT12_PARJU|nr:RecName: Full=Probable non-specific lipid-transfer protein 1; Short=LTP; AltName: Full=Allergen Par j I; AltName: Full=Major pollen allergen Par j 1.0102; AltName: Full=Protein P9; AltName: Allergen=Par j 1.0102; Flags: Precursor [Parietaria judaica]CAA65123.1 P9 protein [Parietaria judaica]
MRTVSAPSAVALVVIVAAGLAWTSLASVAPPAPAPGSEETCGTVVRALMPCLPFVQGKEKEPSKGCCSGAKRLDGETKTGLQRVHACECIQTAMKTYSDIDGKLVSEVPKHCGIVDSKLPPIDVNMDCKTLGVVPRQPQLPVSLRHGPVTGPSDPAHKARLERPQIRVPPPAPEKA